MSNNLDLIKKINNELGDKPELKETKTVNLLKDLIVIVKGSNNDKNFNLVQRELNNIFNKIDIKDYTDKFDGLETLLTEIKNKEIKLDELEKLLNKLIEVISSQKFPKEIEVSNFPEQKEFPTKISVDNFPEQKNEIEVINFPEEKEFPKEIKVSNLPKKLKVDIDKQIGIKKPVWYKPLILEPFFTKISDIVTTIPDAIAERIVLIAKNYQKKENAIAVKLVDKDGKFIDKLIPPIHISNPAGSPGKRETSLTDENGNPITEDNPLHVSAEAVDAAATGPATIVMIGWVITD